MQRTHQPILGVTKVEIGIGNAVKQHVAYVCNDLAQELLLGADFLQASHCVVDFNKNEITINRWSIPMIRKKTPTVCRVGVAASASTTIRPRSMVNVNCRVEKSSIVDRTTGVLEPEQSFKERYAIGIIKVAATVNNGTILVRMFNPHPKPLSGMYKGSTVGQLYPLADGPEQITRSCYHVAFPVESQEPTFCGEAHEGTPGETEGEEIENIAGLFKIGNPNISEDAKKKVYEILSRHAKAISTGKRNLGVMRGVEHSIKTKAIQPNQSATKKITLRSEDRSKKECSHLTSSNLPIPIHGPHQWCQEMPVAGGKDGHPGTCSKSRRNCHRA